MTTQDTHNHTTFNENKPVDAASHTTQPATPTTTHIDTTTKPWSRATNTHNPDLCWEWQGALNSKGYGSLQVNKQAWLAHRYTYTITKGPVPPGLMVCHTCDNKKCINPNHLFTGTHTDNMQDMTNKGRHPEQQVTHCPAGHEYTETNTYRTPSRPNQRLCRTCIKQRNSKRPPRTEYNKQYWQKHKNT